MRYPIAVTKPVLPYYHVTSLRTGLSRNFVCVCVPCADNPVMDMDMGCGPEDRDSCQASVAATLPAPLTPMPTSKVSVQITPSGDVHPVC